MSSEGRMNVRADGYLPKGTCVALGAATFAAFGCATSGAPDQSTGGDAGFADAAADARAGADASTDVVPSDGGPAADEAWNEAASSEAGEDAMADAGPVVGPYVRFANFVPDAPPLDLCLVPHGSGQSSVSLLKALPPNLASDAGTAGRAALAYAQVSNYVDLSTLSFGAGAYDLLLLAAGQDCDAGTTDGGFAGLSTSVPSLQGSTFYTLAAMGDASPLNLDAKLQVAPFIDESVPPVPDYDLRFINAAADAPSLDFNQYGTPILVEAYFGQAASLAMVPVPYAPITDAYLATNWDLKGKLGATISPGTVTTHTYAATALLANQPTAGIVTFIAIGGKSYDSVHPPAIVECQDGSVLPQAFLSPCTVLPAN
jgi:hypothetical protein